MSKQQLTSVSFQCTIRGYHVYGKDWFPVEEEELLCYHEIGNIFDIFAIKTVSKDCRVVGHLPREISRPTKFLLDRGAVVTATISDNKYRRSPLLQGGLEIPCKVRATLPATQRGVGLLDHYNVMVIFLSKFIHL